jgi:hypothetical protein
MSAVDGAKIWSLNYRVLLSVISCAEADITALGLDSKELFLPPGGVVRFKAVASTFAPGEAGGEHLVVEFLRDVKPLRVV